MIVYGSNDLALPTTELADAVRSRLFAAVDQSPDLASDVLVFAGQLEQACLDGGLSWSRQAADLSDAAARYLIAASDGRDGAAALANARQSAEVLSRAVRTTCGDIVVRAPEGFAYYGLRPDGYVDAAREWLAVEPARRVRVVGLLTIGTALSAVVAAALKQAGRDVERLCVRPVGHPFARRIELPPARGSDEACIIVDEGPGLSGSSLAGAAAAACSAGYRDGFITLMAGHAHGPGPQASADVRRWWRCVRVLTASAAPVPIALARTALGEDLAGDPVDIAGGRWTEISDWREARCMAPRLERPKWLATGVTGHRVVLKFHGFDMVRDESGTVARYQRLIRCTAHVAARGQTNPVLGWGGGWTSKAWVDGPVPARSQMLPVLARYLSHEAEPRLDQAESERRFERLSSILSTNAECLCGGAVRQQVRSLLDRCRKNYRRLSGHAYFDGRMGRQHWRCGDGVVIKLDCEDHSDDHSAVGAQSVLWDVAGAAVEWEFDDGETNALIRAVCPDACVGPVRSAAAARRSILCLPRRCCGTGV